MGISLQSPPITTTLADGDTSHVPDANVVFDQLALKAPLASPTFTGTITTALTASRAVATGSSSELAASATTATELGYVSGVTSAIQTQMNLKAPLASPTFTGTVTTPATASRALVTGSSSELAAATTTATEIGYVNGVTSAIQTQINTKKTDFTSSQVLCDTPNGHGSGSTKIRRYTNATTTGTDITRASDSTLGDTFTINTAGVYALSVSDASTAGGFIGFSVNSNQLTTSVLSITAAHRIILTGTVATYLASVSATVRCAVNDVIRVHDDASFDGASVFHQFNIIRIY